MASWISWTPFMTISQQLVVMLTYANWKLQQKTCCFNLYMDWAHTSSLCEMRIKPIVCICFEIFSLLKTKCIWIHLKTMDVSPYKSNNNIISNRMYVRICIWSCAPSGKFLFKDRTTVIVSPHACRSPVITLILLKNYYYSKRA